MGSLRRIRSKVTRALRYRRFSELGNRDTTPDHEVAVVWGNCQAEPLAEILGSSGLGDNFEVVRVPPVHQISAEEAEILHRLLARTTLLVAQQVRDGYRDLPIGTDDLESRLPSGARTIRIPVLYYEGLFPYQVYIRSGGHLSESAPRTSYADLRTLVAASRGVFGERGVDLAASLRSDAAGVARNEASSRESMASRESHLDIQVSGHLRGSTFHTVNHPGNGILAEIAAEVCGAVGLTPRIVVSQTEYLRDIYSPLESHVLGALGREDAPRDAWRIHARDVEARDIFHAHLEWYRSRPELVRSGMAQYEDKLSRLGLR